MSTSKVPSSSSPAPSMHRERFDLQFVFAWVTATALLLSLTEFESYHPYGNAYLFGNNLLSFAAALVNGLCSATWLYVAKRMLRPVASTFPSLAGHWLALACGLIFLGRSVGHALFSIMRSTVDDGPTSPWLLSVGLFVEAIVWLALVAAPFKAETWKWYCLTSAIWLCGMAMVKLLSPVMDERDLLLASINVFVAFTGAISLILTVMAVEEDLEQRRQRDWLHWVGVLGIVIGTPVGFVRFFG